MDFFADIIFWIFGTCIFGASVLFIGKIMSSKNNPRATTVPAIRRQPVARAEYDYVPEFDRGLAAGIVQNPVQTVKHRAVYRNVTDDGEEDVLLMVIAKRRRYESRRQF